MLKKRIGIWAIFLAACLVIQLIVTIIPSAVITIKQWNLDNKLESFIQEQQEAATTPPTEVTQPSDPSGDETGDDDASKEAVSSMISTMIEIIATASSYIGILIVIFGTFNFVLAFMRDDPEARSRAIPMIVVGVMLVGASALLPSLFGGTSG